jgi:hypothetical protein
MLDYTSISGVLKRYFANKAIENTIAKKKPAIYKSMSRKTDLGGDKFSGSQILRDIFTVSPDFDIAYELAEDNQVSPGLKFELPPQELHAPVLVSSKAEALSRSSNAAWVKALGLAAASGMRCFHHTAGFLVLGTGFGEVSTTAITYTPGDAFFTIGNGAVTKFIEGMPLVAADSIHGDALRSTTAAKVTEVDYSTGKVTTDVASLSGTLSWATGDFVFLAGARQNSGTPARVCMVGLRTWLPEVRPVTDATITTVEGTLRTGDSRAFGQQVTQSGTQIDALTDLVTTCVVQGNAENLKINVSSARYREIGKELRTDQRFVNSTSGNAGWLKLAVNASEITVEIIVDRELEDDVGYALSGGAYELVTSGEYPHVQEQGGTWIKPAAKSGFEMRLYGVGVAFLNDPPACGVVKFSAIT